MNKFNGFNIISFVFLSQQDCLRIHCNSAHILHLKLIAPHTLLILNTSFVSALCSIKALSDSKMLTRQKVDITHSYPKNWWFLSCWFFSPCTSKISKSDLPIPKANTFFLFILSHQHTTNSLNACLKT